MAKAFTELTESDEAAGLHYAEWLALLLDREGVHHHDKRLGARQRAARLRHQATPEDIDYRTPRGLDRRLMQELLKGDWIGAYENLAITGPTGRGQVLASLRAWSSGLPRQPRRPLCSRILGAA